jgi:hypothetical protein
MYNKVSYVVKIGLSPHCRRWFEHPSHPLHRRPFHYPRLCLRYRHPSYFSYPSSSPSSHHPPPASSQFLIIFSRLPRSFYSNPLSFPSPTTSSYVKFDAIFIGSHRRPSQDQELYQIIASSHEVKCTATRVSESPPDASLYFSPSKRTNIMYPCMTYTFPSSRIVCSGPITVRTAHNKNYGVKLAAGGPQRLE